VLAAEGVAIELVAVEVCDVVKPMEPRAAANAFVADAGRDNVAQVSAEVSAADMTQARPADMAESNAANVTAAKMHAAEMAAATEVATTTVAAATAAAGKGVRREAQRANGDARQEHLCCLGHHNFPPDIGLRACALVHPNLCLCRETTSAGLPCLRQACADARGNSVLALVRRGARRR
jgi:hypothetical protein